MSQKREFYIDNLKSLMILLLFPFHASLIYGAGEFGGFFVYEQRSFALHFFQTFVFPWYMTLMMVLSGMSCRYSLEKRTMKEFMKNRVKRLLIPFLLGMIFLVPVQSYIGDITHNGYTGNYFQHLPVFCTYFLNICGYFGDFTLSHLWYVAYLFGFSFLLLPVILLKDRYLPGRTFARFSYPALLLLFIPETACIFIINLLSKSIGQYFFLYATGYFLFTREDVKNEVRKYRYMSLVLWLISGVVYTLIWCLTLKENKWLNPLYAFFGWTGILMLIGFGQEFLNFSSRFTQYLSRVSFHVYLFHMPILVVTAYYVVKLSLPVWLSFLLIILISAAITFPFTQLYLWIKGKLLIRRSKQKT